MQIDELTDKARAAAKTSLVCDNAASIKRIEMLLHCIKLIIHQTLCTLEKNKESPGNQHTEGLQKRDNRANTVDQLSNLLLQGRILQQHVYDLKEKDLMVRLLKLQAVGSHPHAEK